LTRSLVVGKRRLSLILMGNKCSQDAGDDYPIQGLTPAACCAACQEKKTHGPGTCAAAVISASYDDPPNACWLKYTADAPMRKSGAKACWPPGHKSLETIEKSMSAPAVSGAVADATDAGGG
jgi:hypothetical protein